MNDPAADPGAAPRHVHVYGNDHSPWVQAVLLGLHARGIPTTLVLAPPWRVFLRSGVLMPAARFDDGPWQLDSERILVALGHGEVDPTDRALLSRLFLRSARSRVDDRWRVWARFALVRDGDPHRGRRLWHQFWRAFSIFYFFWLITYARRATPPPSDEELSSLLSALEDRLPETPFFGGDAPDTVDFQLFGIVQMCASIPGPPLRRILEGEEHERLRGFASRMQDRFRTCPHLYTGPVLDPPADAPAAAPADEKLAFWLGAVAVWIALPVTLPLVFALVVSIRRRGLVGA